MINWGTGALRLVGGVCVVGSGGDPLGGRLSVHSSVCLSGMRFGGGLE